MAKKMVRKKCEKCGVEQWALPRARLCRRSEQRGFGWATCWGRLVTVKPAARPEVSPQEAATKKLALARKMVSEKTRQMRRLATSLHMWEQRATYYARRASMTDAEVEAERAKARAAEIARAEAKRRRGIKLDGGL